MPKFWEGFSEEQKSQLAGEIFDKYRKSGFPYYLRLNARERKILYNSLSRRSWKRLITRGHVKQTMHGLGAVWSYFPHSWEVKCGKNFSPKEVFDDDTLFRKAIIKRLKDGTYLSDSGIRKALKNASGTQAVSNFRPTAAAALYDCFGGGDIYDMSCGYGGRLLGALISRKARSYLGVDPCQKTYDGLLELESDFNFPKRPVAIHKAGSEDFKPPEASIDICFTSPPYFDTELYDTDPTQSYLKFPTYSEWLDGFIGGTLANCFHCLRETGVLLYNIAHTKRYPDLEKDFVATAVKHGFALQETLWLDLSVISDGYKCEPIFVFTKKRSGRTATPDLSESATQVSFLEFLASNA